MTPFEDFAYFGLLLYIAVPTLVLGWLRRLPSYWPLAATLVVLAMQYGPFEADGAAWWQLSRVTLFQLVVAVAFLQVRRRTDHRLAVWIAAIAALLPLLSYKIAVRADVEAHAAFLGLSYLTLRCLDVIIVIQDRLVTSLDLRSYLAYVLFFPTLTAGPIDRYRRFATDLVRRRTRAAFLEDVDAAVRQFYLGLLYKCVLAALIKRYWLDTAAGMVSYMYAYTLFLYLDFAGYSAMAIGTSYLLGVHTPQNFARPFLATNIREFWNRWHITLSWWLRDHVYKRFLMAALRGRWFRDKVVASSVGYLLAFGLMGVWHGLAWHYLLYGLYHGFLMIGYDLLARWNRKSRWWGDGPAWRLAGIVLTFHAFCFSMLLFTGRLWNTTRPNLAGQVESVTCEGIRGWAWDSGRPSEAVTVAVSSYRPLGTVVADLPRPDLSGAANGRHGFFFPLPEDLKDGYPHGIRVRVVESGRQLENSPMNFTCGDVDLRGLDGAVRHADCHQVAGRVRDQTRDSTIVTVEVYLDGKKVATADTQGDFVCALPPRAADGRPHQVRAVIAGSGVELQNSPVTVQCP